MATSSRGRPKRPLERIYGTRMIGEVNGDYMRMSLPKDIEADDIPIEAGTEVRIKAVYPVDGKPHLRLVPTNEHE